MTATDRSLVTSIETYSGHYLDYHDPQPHHIELEDIARGLSQTCRFAGQTTRFYSVAEHAVYVSYEVEKHCDTPELALAALHHDSHEAYTADWPSPLKRFLASEDLITLTERLDYAIAQRFGFQPRWFDAKVIHAADKLMLRREAATLKYSHGIGPHWCFDTPLQPLAGIGWMPDRAERKFIQRHHALSWML